MKRTAAIVSMAALAVGTTPARADQSQAEIAAPAGSVVRRVHGVGAQIYECKRDGRGGLAWSFREPIASLIGEGTTVRRHFAGPSWQMSDGSLVTGTPTGKAPGTSAVDIPWLRLVVATQSGAGILSGVTTIQRVSTTGGVKAGPCSTEGALAAEPYAADYVFSRP